MTFQLYHIQWSRDKASRYWDHLSQRPSQETYFSKQVGQHLLKTILAKITINADSYVLDYGCGPGYLLNYLSAYNAKFDGADFSPTSLSIAQQSLKNTPGFTKAHHLKADTPLPQNTYTHLISTETVEHILDKELEPAFQTWHKALKPGGYLILTTPNAEDLEANKKTCPDCGCTFHPWQHVQSWSEHTLSK